MVSLEENVPMSPDTPVHTLDECFNYLNSNRWQFQLLDPGSHVTVNAKMLRSLYFHIGCAKFGVPFSDNIEALGLELRRLSVDPQGKVV